MSIIGPNGSRAITLDSLTFKDYQAFTDTTVLPAADNLSHHIMTVVAEALELLGKICPTLVEQEEIEIVQMAATTLQKGIRSGEIQLDDTTLVQEITRDPKRLEGVLNEAGDVLWGLSQLCSRLGMPLAAAAHANHTKLTSRKARGVIEGDGDNR